jgi:hypothetical protein
VSTTTIDDQLAEVDRRIERLRAHAPAGTSGENERTLRLLDGLRQRESTARVAARQAPDEFDERLAELNTRLDVAEHSLAADLAEDRAAFATAVEAELHSWDTYLERLQTSVAARACEAREQAETAIGHARSRRIAVDERLAQVRAGTEAGWQQERRRVTEARDELERNADALSANLTSTKSK